jgi:hypothetical protein
MGARGRTVSGQTWARGAIALWALLWIVNDALPFVGGRDDSCQTMFSALEWGVGGDGRAWNNHLVVGQHMLFDRWVVLELDAVRVEGEAVDARDRALSGWITREGRARSLDAVRVVVDQLCERHTVSLRYRRHWPRPTGAWGAAHPDDSFVEVADACADPFVSQPIGWIPVRLYETDFPLAPEATP